MKHILAAVIMMAGACGLHAADPMLTSYSASQCEGSLTPYPTDINPAVYPDSLTPVFINHVGRHGARYPASAANCMTLRRALERADSAGTITPAGRKLRQLNEYVITQSTDRWGSLDSLGMAEQRAIATRMFYNFGEAFSGGTVNAISSYSPRAMMSMYCFTHQLDRMDNRINFVTTTGRMNSPLMRFFDLYAEFVEYKKQGPWMEKYNEYVEQYCPTSAIDKVLGRNFPYSSDRERLQLALVEYYVIAGCSAMSVDCNTTEYFTKDEYNALWSCFNLRQYLCRTATTVSAMPADIAAELLTNLITTTEEFIEGNSPASVQLRFGHAETLMPLLSLLHLPGCYYLTNYFDTVGQHWRDFDVVPMAANLQMILFKAKGSGRYYLRVDLNEQPVSLIPNNTARYIPWQQAREYMLRCLPL